MKKVLGVMLVAVLVIGASGVAMARWGGPGDGYGPRGHMMGGGPGWGPGRGACAGGPGAAPVVTPIDEAKAKTLATEYVTKHFAGYEIQKYVKFERPRGTMYQVELKGPQGEVQYLHINPFGYVMPPRFGAGRTF